MYTIVATYITGDSFGHERVVHEIAMVWENLELAKQAMRELHEHYEAFSERKEFEEVKHEPWVDDGEGLDIWEFSIKLELDSGRRQFMHIPWTGYFERLEELKISIVDETAEMRIVI